MSKPLIGISACLLGHNVRYNGGNNFLPQLVAYLESRAELSPLCPETGAELGIPREPMSLHRRKEGYSLLGNESAADKTDPVTLWITAAIDDLGKQKLCGLIVKAKSPSCGLDSATLVDGDRITFGSGLFTEAVIEAYPIIPIVEETGLTNTLEIETFFQRTLSLFELYYTHNCATLQELIRVLQ